MDSRVTDFQKWARQRRLAETHEKLALRDNPPDPAAALVRGLALIDFVAQVRVGTASTATDISAEDLMAYRRWALVRNSLRVA